MDALVTGSTGFVGAHVVRALLARGDRVRVFVREGSSRANLAGLDVEIASGDLTDLASLRRAVRGVRVLYHCAGDYRFGVRAPWTLYAANVNGTDNLMRAAFDEGVERVVYTSSVGALGLTADGRPSNESTPVHLSDVVGHYKKSKLLAERVVDAWVARGLPAVLVHPTTPIGDLDVKPTPTGRIILDFLRGKMRAFVRTGLNLVDVRDVANGHLLAAEQGQDGRRYILGNRNITLKEMFDILARMTELRSPWLRLPHWVPMVFATADTALSRLKGRDPGVPIESVRMSRDMMFFDSSRARRELGFAPGSVENAIERAVDWFRGDFARVHAMLARPVRELTLT